MSHIIVESPTAEGQRCPHLGLHDDPGTALSYPSSWNYCYHATPPASVLPAHQAEACLCPLYVNCVVYQTGKTDPLPASLHGRRAGRQRYDTPRRSGRWLAFLFLAALFLLAPFLLFGFPSAAANDLLSLAGISQLIAPVRSPEPEAEPAASPAVSTRVPPSESAENALLVIKPGLPGTPTRNSAPRASLTPSPAERAAATSASGTAAPAQTAGMCGHALDEPFGEDPRFVLHRVVSGENLTLYADQYETAADAILAVNHHLPMPVWPDWILVIPVGTEDLSAQVPPFETYQAIETKLSLEELAEQLGTDPELLARYNAFDDRCQVFSGWLLVPRDR